MAKPRTPGAKNPTQLKDIYLTIKQNPGIRAYRVSKILNKPSGTISSAMASMDIGGFFVSEDEHGFLYPFHTSSPQDAQNLYAQTRR